ncbi:MAG: VOC family protein [Bacteroidales bacterium]|nr:VOC family protein [Bacteroidales bacterium]
MNKPFKPEGYNSLSPYFVVKEAQRFIDFLKELFNAKELRRYDMPDGTIMHAEVAIDDSVLMVGQSTDQYPPNTHLMHVYVQDVDEMYNKAIELGCEPVQAPKTSEDDPDKRGMFNDFAGNMWAVSTQMGQE